MVQDILNRDNFTLTERLVALHEQICGTHSALCRIAIAVYDAETDKVKTFAQSNHGPAAISFYEARLADLPSLQSLSSGTGYRVLNNLTQSPTDKPHKAKLSEAGIASSMTMPIRYKGALFGFIFFNATETDFFTDARAAALSAYAGVISLLLVNELQNIQTFKGAVKTAREFSRHRDEETGNHLERMSRYSRLIAKHLAPKYGYNDDWVEYVFQFSPLHDVGKVAIPDSILLKPGRLNEEELEIMRSHVVKGEEILDIMKDEFGLQTLQFFDMLIKIVAHHHEAYDGSGYPYGLAGENIPLEARIVTVADVFDALTSDRPYKKAWTNEAAFNMLKEGAGTKFDPQCVNILYQCQDDIHQIQNTFKEDFMG